MVGYYKSESVELSDKQIALIKDAIKTASKEKDPIKRALEIAELVRDNLTSLYSSMKKSGKMSLGWDDLIMSIAQSKDKHIFLLQQALSK